ncbi:MAG: amylo-alpha-1,6-glucosidase, partial [Nocardiopsaceae bacterium]|nr:amylo-alpha-1,6-glucosidase [Nocardiopsaceae bacterium]
MTVLSAPTVALSEHGGQIRPDGAQGVLHADVRVLSQAVLALDGAEPVPVSDGMLDSQTARFAAVPRALGDGIVDPTVRVERTRSVTAGEVSESIRVVSFADSGVATGLTLAVAADLADLADINSGRTAAAPVPPELTGGGLTWGRGQLRVTLSAPGASFEVSAADPPGAVIRWQVRVAGRGEHKVGWRLSVADPEAV